MSSSSLSAPGMVENLYVSHHSWLVNWLRAKLGSSEQAADVAHDVFVRILQKVEWQAPREPRAYLTVIAKGLVINLYQRQAIELAYVEALAALPEQSAPSEEERHIILETLTRLQLALSQLPAAVSSVFLMSQLDGLRYAEIAERTGLSLRTVNRYMVMGFEQCLMVMAQDQER